MSWLTFTWSMVAATCLTLGAFHAVIGFRLKTVANRWFALAAVAAAGIAVCELLSMRADTPAKWAAALRWGFLIFFVLFVSVVGFVRTYFRAGRPWLGWTAVAVRLATVVVNFAKPPNLNWASITAVRSIPFWFGERVFVPIGTVSKWTRLGQASMILLLAFLIDASITVWRRDDRRKAIICASAVFFIFANAFQTYLIHAQLIHYPYLVSMSFLLVVATMSYDLTRDVVRASELAGRLQISEASLIESRDRALQAEERFRGVVEAAPSAMILIDSEGKIVLVNAQAESLFGYSRDELVGLPVETLLPERVRVHHREFREDYLRRPTARPMGAGRDLSGRRKDGSEVPVEIGLNPIRGSVGTFILASVIDISERRRTALELEQQRNELAHLSRLTMVGELAGSLAHELNQPLTAILANAQAAQRYLGRTPPDLSEVTGILADIVDSNKHAGEVISRLRAMLRKGEMRREKLDMSDVVSDVLRLARSDLLNHGVVVETELSGNLPAVDGDRVQLLQVLLNLVVNGCDAMAATVPEARRLVLRTEPADGNGVHVSVSDHGTGIGDGQAEKIFEPFITSKPHGMGLGLSVCRTIVTAHGGRIWATNNASVGATFHLRLPAANGA
jgi:PAS domain S-box-containing protein